MKSNSKTKNTVTKKVSPATKIASKKVVKSTKPVAKTVAKLVAKKGTPPKSVKVVAKKAPAKAVKIVAKPVSAKKVIAKVAAPAKKAVATKQVAKAVKAVVKAPAKKIVAPKIVVKATPVKIAAVKSPVKEAIKPAAKTAAKNISKVTAVQPVMVKMPNNQNAPVKPSIIVAMRPQAVATTMQRNNASSSVSSARPAYLPIQVINKPLTPAHPARQMAPISKADEKVEFKKGDYVVYPAHGVGEIEAVETQIIGGMEIKLYAIVFEKDRMRLKVPVFKAHASGLRRLSSANRMQDALKTLQGRAQIRRAMWSRRAQEYETKINSGDPVSIAEVLRDLKRSNDDTEQSYSERQIYQSALARLAREVAAVDKISEIEAAERLENMIKGRRSRSAVAADALEVPEAIESPEAIEAVA